jgi:hypothetical protein
MTQVKFNPDHNDRRLALLLAAVALAIYLRTVAPDLLPGDPGELQFAAWRLGLAHPTGYPLYLIAGWFWQHALAWVGVSPAAALNAFSAVCASFGVALLYLVMARAASGPPVLRRMAGLYSAVLLMVNLTYWSQALVAEVYALHTALMLGLLWRAQRLVNLPTPRRLTAFALLAGLALTHHALTVLWLAALALYLIQSGMLRLFHARAWITAAGAVLLPLLLYAYIPLRSGPAASPWYHQTLGDTVLSLYVGGWDAFWSFLSGRSIGASFRSVGEAWDQVAQAGRLWQYHFGWVGLAMIAAGLLWLIRRRAWTILGFTFIYAMAQQVFNLFYAIGDILVYYIPLYVIGALWAGFGLVGLASGRWSPGPMDERTRAPWGGLSLGGWLVILVALTLAVRDAPHTSVRIDQSESRATRTYWEAIAAAPLPPDAVLISNDRNEIVPLFYLQYVEQRGLGWTGLFPAIAPDARFADLAATLDTALATGASAYLIKDMPELAIKYQLDPAPPPLIAVTGLRAAPPPAVTVEQSYGPLHLLGYDVAATAASWDVTLHWRVDAPIPGDYTETVQLLDGDVKLAQDDRAPGGVYLPTSDWRAGDLMVVTHSLVPTQAVPSPATLLVGMYRPEDMTPLHTPLRLDVRLPAQP